MRSPFAAAVTSTLYPEIEALSAGTEPDVNGTYHSSAIGLATEWGIKMKSGSTMGLPEIAPFLKTSEFIVVAENSMRQKVLEYPSDGDLLSFSDLSMDQTFVPDDPIGLSESNFRVQMSKVAYNALRSFSTRIYPRSEKRIQVVIPISESFHDLALAH